MKIDGVEADVEAGSTIKSAAVRLKIDIPDGCTLAVRRVVEIERVQTNLYQVITTRGKMIIRLECDRILEGWRKSFKRFEGTGIRWATRDAAVFGPVTTDFEPSRESVELKQNEITLSLSGFSNENTHLVFSRKVHTGAYAPPRDCGVLGRVVYGRHVVGELRLGDKIMGIEPVLETKSVEGAVLRTDKSYKFTEPVEVITKVGIELDRASPLSGELVYKTLSPGTFTVSRRTSRFIADDGVSMVSIANERQDRRARGAVTVRNAGSNTGSVYLYLKDAALTPGHNITGKVMSGIDLADVALENDSILAYAAPERLDILGTTQILAEGLLQKRGIKQLRSGDASDSAIVVEHRPPTTIEVYGKGEADCFGVKESQILKVRLFESLAPTSVKYFRRVTGLDLKRTGKLTVYFSTSKMDMALFKGDEVLAKELLPENVPVDKVGVNLIGVTNAVKRYAGMVGVRLTESSEYGPTAERFEGTNMIGEVVENAQTLKHLAEKKAVYVTEVP